MMIKKYRKRPIVVEAMQFQGLDASLVELREFVDSSAITIDPVRSILTLTTRKGVYIVSQGDYIIKDVTGEYCPWRSDLFELTYEPVEEGLAAAEACNGEGDVIRG